MLLDNVLSVIPIIDNAVFSNGPKRLPKDPPECVILCNWVFDNLILPKEPSALMFLETCVLVNNNLCEKLFSSLESLTAFDEIFKVT